MSRPDSRIWRDAPRDRIVLADYRRASAGSNCAFIPKLSEKRGEVVGGDGSDARCSLLDRTKKYVANATIHPYKISLLFNIFIERTIVE